MRVHTVAAGAAGALHAMHFVRFCKLVPFWASLQIRSFYQKFGERVEKHRAFASPRRVCVVLWGV